jgi:hypothetical protein
MVCNITLPIITELDSWHKSIWLVSQRCPVIWRDKPVCITMNIVVTIFFFFHTARSFRVSQSAQSGVLMPVLAKESSL